MRTLLFTRVATSPPHNTTTGRLLRVRGSSSPSSPQARSATAPVTESRHVEHHQQAPS